MNETDEVKTDDLDDLDSGVSQPPARLGRFARRRDRPKHPTPTPLQADLDQITMRLNPGMKQGCLQEIERVRKTLDGSLERAKTDMAGQAEAQRVIASDAVRELDNTRRTLDQLTGNALHVRQAIEELPEKPTAKELRACLATIAGLVDAKLAGSDE